jgi:hypothetical protein
MWKTKRARGDKKEEILTKNKIDDEKVLYADGCGHDGGGLRPEGSRSARVEEGDCYRGACF